MRTLSALLLTTTVAFGQTVPPPPNVWAKTFDDVSWNEVVNSLIYPNQAVKQEVKYIGNHRSCNNDVCVLSFFFNHLTDKGDKVLTSMDAFYKNDGNAYSHLRCNYNDGPVATCQVWENGNVVYKIQNEDGTWSMAKTTLKQ